MREKKKTVSILLNLSPEDKEKMLERAKLYGFSQLSEFIRVMVLTGKLEIK